MNATVGDAGYARGFRRAAWFDRAGTYREADFVPSSLLDRGPSRAAFEARYGKGSMDRERSLQGEKIVVDWVVDLAEELDLPLGYRLTGQDVIDLRMVVGLYPALQRLFRKKFGVEPGVGTSKPPNPKPPEPRPPDPPVIPVPATPPASGLSSLEVRVEELRTLAGKVAANYDSPITNLVGYLCGGSGWPPFKPFAVAGLRLYRAALARLEGK